MITTDSMSKNGISHTISVRHCCIATMKEYESKSYEELRFEDYSVGRKGKNYHDVLWLYNPINLSYYISIIIFS